MSEIAGDSSSQDVKHLKNQLNIARNEINNLRQQLKTLTHAHRKDCDDIRKKLENWRCLECRNRQLSQDYCGASSQNQIDLPLQYIGVIQTHFPEKRGTPRQPGICSNLIAKLTLTNDVFTNPEHALEGLQEYSHMWIIFHFHKNDSTHTRAKVAPPRLNGLRTGVFATRSPHRPCPIGLSLVKIDRIMENTIYFSGVDMVDQTPVLDIKPYIPKYDNPTTSVFSASPDEFLSDPRAFNDDSPSDISLDNTGMNDLSTGSNDVNISIDNLNIRMDTLDGEENHTRGQNVIGGNITGSNVVRGNLGSGSNIVGSNMIGSSNIAGSFTSGSNITSCNVAGNKISSNILSNSMSGSNIIGNNIKGGNLVTGNITAGNNMTSTNLVGSNITATSNPLRNNISPSLNLNSNLDESFTRTSARIGEREAPDGEEEESPRQQLGAVGFGNNTPTHDGPIRVPTWIDNPPVPTLTVIFKDRALVQLSQLGNDAEDKKTIITNILREDPRSVYLRERMGSHCYVFRIAELNVSCKFNDAAHAVTVFKIFQNSISESDE